MDKKIRDKSVLHRVGADISVSLGIAALIFFFVASSFLSYRNTRTLSLGAQEVARTHEVALALEDVWALVKDAETGQRGFILTGDEKYLEPYTSAVGQIDQKLDNLQNFMDGYPELQSRIPLIRTHMQAKLRELSETITLRRTTGFEAALAVVATDRGKNEMDIVRGQILALEQ